VKLIYDRDRLAAAVLDSDEEIVAVRTAVRIALRQGLDRSLADPLERILRDLNTPAPGRTLPEQR